MPALLLLFAFQSMFISIRVSRLEIVEFPDSVRLSAPYVWRYHCSRVSRENEEMIDIMWRRATVCTDVEAFILLDSSLGCAQETTISGSYLSEG